MADAEPATPAKKKKGKLKPLLMIGGVLLLLGGGIGGGLFLASSGLIGGAASAQSAAEEAKPKLVPIGSKEHAEPKEGEGGKESSEGGEGGPKYEASYFKLEKEFTSNLNQSVHLLQVGLAVSTPYDEKVIQHLEAHELAVRSAILMALSETDEEQVFTSQGKRELQNRLVKAINQTLKQKTGFGGVGNVYFTNFIVQ